MVNLRTRENPSIFDRLNPGRKGARVTPAEVEEYNVHCRSWGRLHKTLARLSEHTTLAYLYLEWSGPNRPHIMSRLRYHHSRLRNIRENQELFGRDTTEIPPARKKVRRG